MKCKRERCRPQLPPNFDDIVRAAAGADATATDDVPSDELWWGEPDPKIYAPGTLKLDKKQLEEEVAKGNVVTLAAFREALDKADAREIDVRRVWGGG
jgi:hypothetical protein